MRVLSLCISGALLHTVAALPAQSQWSAAGVSIEVKQITAPLSANDTWAARVQFDPGNPGDVICVRETPPPPASRLDHIRTLVSLWEKDTTGTLSFFSDQAIYFTIGNDQVILGSTDEAHGVYWFEYKVQKLSGWLKALMGACIQTTGGSRAYTHMSSCDVNAIRPPESSGQYNNKEVVIKYGGVGEWA